jgi:predicted DNA binding CopG/RHH family protein
MTTKKKLSEMTDDELAAVADEVESQARDRARWRETPSSKERQPERDQWVEQNTTSISLRMPNQLLELLKAAAAVEGIGYQTLMKKWLHERMLMLAKERGAKRVDLGSLRSELRADVETLRHLAESGQRSSRTLEPSRPKVATGKVAARGRG